MDKVYFYVNKYSRAYLIITIRAKVRGKLEGYYEKHHIVPKALGGENSLINTVYLTPKEHYVCHHLLTKCTEGRAKRSMLHAWLLMCRCDKTNKRYIPAVQYDYLRRELAKAGKSPEHRAKLSEAALKRKPRKFSEQAKKNMSEARKKDWIEGKYTNNHLKGPKSEQHKENISKAMFGNQNLRKFLDKKNSVSY